jgi:hypothetical protein
VCRFLKEQFSPDMVDGFGEDRRMQDYETAPAAGRLAVGAAFVEHYAAEQLVALGYPESTVQLSLQDRLKLHVFEQPRGWAAMEAWRVTRAMRRRWER